MLVSVRAIKRFAKMNVVFTVSELYNYFKINDNENEKSRCHQLMYGMLKHGILHRYEEGLYGYCKLNLFSGKRVVSSTEEVLERLYLSDGTGYVSGDDYKVQIGLLDTAVTRIIVSNKVETTSEKFGVMIRKTSAPIKEDNIKYLQVLDCIASTDKSTFTCTTLFRVVRRLDFNMLLFYARKYYSQEVLDRLIDLY